MSQLCPDTFCVNPWYQIRINPDASVTYCQRGVDQDQSVTSDDFVQEFRHNDHLIQARAHFASGDTTVLKNCARCFAEQHQGLDQYRVKQNRLAFIHPDHFAESLHQHDVNKKISQGVTNPKYVFVKFNNTCGMSCRMCSPQASSSLNQLYLTHAPERHEARYVTNWPQNPELWQSFLNLTLHNPDLDVLQINGGEPTDSVEFWQLLQLLISQGKTRIKLIVSINCATFYPELVPLLAQFESAVLDMSVETFTQVNDYIRPPSRHDDIRQVIVKYLQQPHDNISYSLHITPQAYSVDDLYTVLDLAEQHASVYVTCNKVWPQQHLDPVVLPAVHKQCLTEFYKSRYQHSVNPSVSTAASRICHWLSVTEPANITELRHQFATETQLHDGMLGTDFVSVFPQLGEFYLAHLT